MSKIPVKLQHEAVVQNIQVQSRDKGKNCILYSTHAEMTTRFSLVLVMSVNLALLTQRNS